MAHIGDLPCDNDGTCMKCKAKPSQEETLTCRTCATPWHVTCLSQTSCPVSLSDVVQWDCPDCSSLSSDRVPSNIPGSAFVRAVRAIESDSTLTEKQKAEKRQALLIGDRTTLSIVEVDDEDVLDGKINCLFCMQLPDRPVTTPCGHNFCLKCFQKWIGQGKRTCAKCRGHIPSSMVHQPRINSALVAAIRMAKSSKSDNVEGPPKVYHQYIHNQDRPDKAFTTERAKKGGKANACSGRIFVTTPNDHLGPILAENDPERNRGVLVGDSWADREECRQWGVHFPHISGIAGQSKHGAQSVVLSGGYIDDEDHGEWFLYTGSGGRDLSGNKRTNKNHSFDQKFEKSNEALRLSCKEGYPVRVIRSHKEKRSSYAPEKGVRYDGIYRIDKCWRKKGQQGYKLCRYLFVRCDNEPAPWTSDDHGDRPRPLPLVKELEDAVDITEGKGHPSWDYDEERGCWMWKKTPPKSKMKMDNGNLGCGKNTKKTKRQGNAREKLLKEFSCQICRKVLKDPLTTPCGHNFCKSCLEAVFAGQSFVRHRRCEGRLILRVKKNVMKCPSCTNDIADFLQNLQVNRELMGIIESLDSKTLGKENVGSTCEESKGPYNNKPDTAADMEESSDSDLGHPPKNNLRKNKRERTICGSDVSSPCGHKKRKIAPS